MKNINFLLICFCCILLFSCDIAIKSDSKNLNSLIIANESINRAGKMLSDYSEKNYIIIEKYYLTEPKLYKDIYERAKNARTYTNDIIRYINILNIELISISEKISFEEAYKLDFNNISHFEKEIPNKYYFGEATDGSKGKAKELKEKIDKYRSAMIELTKPDIRPLINQKSGLKTDEEYLNDDGNRLSWEMYFFYQTNLIANIITINSLKIEVVNLEIDIVKQLISEVTSLNKILKINTCY